MDNARFVTIDSFPTCSKYTRFLSYYMIKSTRVTILSFGSRFILVYVNNKVIKRCILPEDVTCGTIIKVPGSNGYGKLLLCGTDCGSVFAIRLPSNKQDLTTLKNEADRSRTSMSNADYISVYTYRNLVICAISCIDSNILIVGLDEASKIHLIMFQPATLSIALNDGSEGESMDTTSPCEVTPIDKPSPSIENRSELKLVVIKSKETRKSPYHNSLDNVLYIEQSLLSELFEIQESCVACFFFPNGEVWFRTLGYGAFAGSEFKFLTHLREECVGITTVLIDEACDSSRGQIHDEPPGKLMPALTLFGANHNIFVLSSNGKKIQAYTEELRALVRDWNGVIPIHHIFLHHQAKGFNVTSGIISFFGEQCLGIQQSDVLWNLHDYESHTSLLSINLSAILPSTHGNEEISETQINDLIKQLKMAEMQTISENEKSMKITTVIKQVSSLASYIIDNPLCENEMTHSFARPQSLFNFVASCLAMDCGSKKQVNVTIEVINNENVFILQPFNCQLQAVVKCIKSSQSRICTFDLEDLKPGAVKHLCILMDCAEMPSDKVKITIFLHILMPNEVEPDLSDILASGFPLLFEMYSVTMQCKI